MTGHSNPEVCPVLGPVLQGRLWFTYAHLHAGFQEPSYTRGPGMPGYGPRGPLAIRMNRRKLHWSARRVGHHVGMRGGVFPTLEGRSVKGIMPQTLLRRMVKCDTFIVFVYFRFRVEVLGPQGSRKKGTHIMMKGDGRWRENRSPGAQMGST